MGLHRAGVGRPALAMTKAAHEWASGEGGVFMIVEMASSFIMSMTGLEFYEAPGALLEADDILEVGDKEHDDV